MKTSHKSDELKKNKKKVEVHKSGTYGLFVLNHIHFNKHLSICVIRFVIRSEKMR